VTGFYRVKLSWDAMPPTGQPGCCTMTATACADVLLAEAPSLGEALKLLAESRGLSLRDAVAVEGQLIQVGRPDPRLRLTLPDEEASDTMPSHLDDREGQ
jgi:hypothetical protein